MSSGNPKVGPRLRVRVPDFKRTDFSGDIERLGGLSARTGRNAAKRSDVESEKSLLSARSKATTAGALSKVVDASTAGNETAHSDLARTSRGYPASTSGPVFNEWLQSINQKPQGLSSPARHGGTTPSSPRSPMAMPSLALGGQALLDAPDGASSPAIESLDNVPLETFDSAEDFEVHEPEEWLGLCQATPGRPQACVLHYISHEWTMLPCWVHGYEASVKRYLVELEDGSKKHVKRLALRFNAEDPQNFARRVETCLSKKVNCELQQAFINFIESQDGSMVSPMLREHKERFIKQSLHKRCHIEEACNYVGTIRELILEIERGYVLSMKFAKVKDDLIEGNGTPIAVVCQESPFAPLLSAFLPRLVPYLALVQHEMADQSVAMIVEHLDKLPTLTTNIWNVTYAVWRRFGEEVSRHHILDITRRGAHDNRLGKRNQSSTDPNDRVFDPDEFIRHMEDHRNDITVTLSRHWRDFIVSEVLDKMSEGSNFFVDNAQKHLRSPLHRVLRKLDLILNAQMRWFVASSINDWVDFMRSFERWFEEKPSQPLPSPLLTLSLAASDGEVVLVPDPDELIGRVLGLLDGVTKVTSAINDIECELVPFCSLPQTIMFQVEEDDALLEEAKAATEEVIRNCLRGPQEIQAKYQQYAYLLMEEVSDLDPLDIEKVRERTAAYMQARYEIETLTASVVKSPFFELNCVDIMETLSSRAFYLATICLTGVAASVDTRSSAVLAEWDETHARILSNPEDEEELAKLKQFMADINQLKTKPLMATTKHIHKQIDMLSDFSFEISHEVVERAFKSFRHPLQIQIDVADSERSLDNQKQKFMDKLDLEKAEFERDMTKYQEELEWVRGLNDYSMAKQSSKFTRIYTLKDNLDRAKERVQSFVDREKLFNIEMSDYSELDVMNESFEPYFRLWTAAIEFKHSEEEWLTGSLSKLNKEDIDAVVEEQFKESYKMWKQFDGQENPQQVAKDLREDIGAFRANMPIIHAICQEAFQPMHFIMLYDELDTDLDMEEGLTLQQLLEIDILNHIDVVERISGEAQKQHALKTALAGMKREWKPMELITIEYKTTGTYILRGIDDIQTLLDDHIVKTQGIRGSPFVKPIEKEVKDWESRLLYIQDLLEQWLACQRSWLYLEPIFSSDDIQRQMPTEAKRFGHVNAHWRTTMDLVVENPNVLDVSDIESLLPNFSEANKKLDLIQKGLNDYLETKRLAFPRFFFLSNDELLMILSQTKDPTAVQPHMNKCFEGINRVRFNEKNEIIEAMFSVEGEVVELSKPVNVVEGDKKGNVEKWLMEVQDSMISCLTDITGQSVKAYATKQRTDWVLDWPAQSIIAVDNIYWTKEVAAAIESGKLEDYYKTCVSQLSGLVNLVRGDLSKLARQTLSAVVTIDVHNRDVVKDLVNAKISSSKEFDWMAQLRYYWCPKGSVIMKDTEKPNETDKCQVAIINAVLYYGFEYLGNSDRLVITPLTDRCYRTLMGAFHLYYGGAPEGPAGTGKTESTKDLAKACAVQCVVFNCSDGLDYIAMGKFFKGLASSGAWCCFDEFNRINLEVLSVISQQVATIQKAIREKKKVFIFEGTEIQLVPSCAVNITMNPGYAGRSELPDNLKALFRPCAMMVPDYALIGEIVLYSNGFEDAKSLARKAVGSLRLSSEQLSSQDHYDFGMRALKSILVRAGALRRMYGNSRSEAVLALSALNDVNVPKFTSNDIPLFLGIIGDLFPGVELPPSDYGTLLAELEGSAQSLGLQPKKEFIHKCVQLWETIMVRHGLMLVGETASGKTEVENVLAKALEACADGGNYLPVQMYKMNPKSIKQGQLYGDFDDVSHEWSDGILALTVRAASSAEATKWQWVLLDGPVDAVWIENMNTVLDDNKKLCLSSGEIIKLSLVTRMMFEVEDLAAASPATVSRCGMVFLEQVDIGWQVLMQSWIDSLPERLKEFADPIKEMMESVIDVSWEMLQRKIKQPVLVNCNWIVLSFLKLFMALMRLELPSVFDTTMKDLTSKEKELKVDGLFWHALFWSFGCVADEEGRKLLDEFMKAIMNGQPVRDEFKLIVSEPAVKVMAKLPLPETGSVFDYFLTSANKWELWTKKIGNFDIPKDAQMHTIIVPTADTVRNAFLLQTLVQSEYHVLFSGLTGTGKTVVVQQELLKNFDRDRYTSMAFAFSAQTTANQTQDIIDGKLDKRRKGTYGPPLGKRCIVFVDDLNMPAKEYYGAQPPIELLRQWMDTGGWYERKSCEFRSLVDLNFIGAMGPPGAGRPHLTARYQRHYNLIFVVPFENESLLRIFTSVMSWFLSKFPSGVSALGQAVVKASVEVYESISAGMRPTPAKSHYTFNLRDLSKVHQGICLCSKPSLPGPDDLVKCWAHECMRVFQDRLINKDDQAWFSNLLKDIMQTHFKKDWKNVVKLEPLIYLLIEDSKKPYYQEVTDHAELTGNVEGFLMDYNSMAKHTMELVLFMNAVEHVCRIARVLKIPLGNALLVGVGGSGRKSLAMLATFVAEYETFQIEISKNYSTADWSEDVKRLLMRVGAHAKEVTFLLADTQIPKESFLEDTSSLLNNGEVPNLFNAEDKTQILEACTAPAALVGRTAQADIFAYFNEQCRRNLHIVLALSPIGDAFRRRVRMFPSLVNCCTIDWFMEWPDDALQSVADHFLHKVDLARDVFDGVVEICVEMQKSVFDLTSRFFKEVQRYYYVTPTSYLELINSFKDLLNLKRTELSKSKHRYDEGLEKLMNTEEQVNVMSKQLEELRPVLKKTSIETQELMENIETKQKEASKTQIVVSKEEESCSQQAEEARVMKEECQADLDQAMPALNSALEALKGLKKEHLTEVKNLKTPPDGVVLVSKSMCWCFDVKPKKVTAPDGRTKLDDYWEPAKKSLWSDGKMIDRMLNFDKDNIPEDVIKNLKTLEDDPNFEPEAVKKASVAAFGICKWVRAMIVYDGVAKLVQPKTEQLATAEAQLNKVMAELNARRAELQAVQDNVSKLLSEFEAAKKKKDELEVQVDDCSKKLVRAEKLISGLGGEKSRWADSSAGLGGQFDNITGDVLIASGIVAYLGTFMGKYRQHTINKWTALMRSHKVPASSEFELAVVIGEDVAIRQWIIDKLPNDQVSIDNALIMSKSRRWPLMIDPQMQANQWIRQSNREKKLKIIRLSQQGYARVLENAITYGEPVLLENVSETLDPLLDPLLQKAKFKAGNMLMIRLGDLTIEYSEDFRLYITTKLPNPHYPPEVCVQVTLLNFMATPDGLQDQMLGILVAKEEPETEKKRVALILDSAASKLQLKEIEDRILELLSSAKGNILDDEELINTLATSKVASQRIEERVAEQEKNKASVQETRELYVPLAVRASALFFVISELCVVEPMYQYSLEWFINIYALAIGTAEKFDRNVPKRLLSLQKQFIRLLYEKVCDSLFEKDKLMFSLLLAFKSMEVDHELNQEEKTLLLVGGFGTGADIPKPSADWVTVSMWRRIVELDKLNKGPWTNFAAAFKSKIDGWKGVFDADNPSESLWPGNIRDQMTPLQRALMLLAIRTDCTVTGLQDVIASKLGKEFLEPPSFNLEKSYNDSNPCMPMIFVLSSGADPMAEVMRLSAKIGMDERLNAVSLGQGQGKKAEEAVRDGMENGFWTILQNCHLAPSWMPTLEVIVEELSPDKVDQQFRLWLTSMPSPEFPVSVLQNGLKMTNEPPKGLKSNLLRAYLSFEDEWFQDACKKNESCQHAFRKMLFGLCFFHALIQERCKYGALGWNIPYQFSEPDRQICVSQLQMFLEENDSIPYDALRYTAAEANYGGRVTDTHDRRCMSFILTDFYCPEILNDNYRFSTSGYYYAPPFNNLEGYIEYIRSLPINQMPEAFGLHANANLVAAIGEATRILQTACSMQPKTGAGDGGRSNDDILTEMSSKFLNDLPNPFDQEAVCAKYPVDYKESMNTVLTQELLRFNKLLIKVRSTLVDIGKAVKGLVAMSPELDDVANGILLNVIPSVWIRQSYPSLKPVASYVTDLGARLKFFNGWVDNGIPTCFWLSGFYFTQSFLTGQLQNFARKFTLPIDTLIWTFKILKRSEKDFAKPATGCIVHGLFLDGARWDDNEGVIGESLPKVLFDSIPHIHIVPCESAKDTTDRKVVYTSPVYKTSERKGTLSTTGHSTNFVMPMLIPIAKQHNEKYWAKRGVACLTQLDE